MIHKYNVYIWVEGKHNLGDLGVDVRIILKWMLRKGDVMMLIGG
jgi:hypothetical protein